MKRHCAMSCIATGMLLFVLASCSSINNLTKLIPVQLARVPQTENFTETFIVPDKLPDWLGGHGANSSADTKIDTIFSKLVGSRNWQNIKDLYVVADLPQQVASGMVSMTGNVNFVIYVNPIDQSKVVIEGAGRFYIIRSKESDLRTSENGSEILMSGDFSVIPEQHNIDEFDKGVLPLKTEFFVSRIPQRTTYYNSMPLEVDVKLDTSLSHKKIYAINYKATHDVYMLNPQHINDKDRLKIGTMKIEGENSFVKLIDMRGVEYLRNDYKKELLNSGMLYE